MLSKYESVIVDTETQNVLFIDELICLIYKADTC
jgi:hypothetical protein